MRKLIKIALLVLAVRMLMKWLRNRRTEQELEFASTTTVDPAVELREKLAESRGDDVGGDPEPPEASVEDRRADVHEQGRAALDEMKPSDES